MTKAIKKAAKAAIPANAAKAAKAALVANAAKAQGKGKASIPVNDIKAYEMPAISNRELLGTEKAIKLSINAIQKSGRELQRVVHIAACSVLRHVGKNSDVRLVTAMLDALPETYRKNGLKEWFAFYGPISFEKGKTVFVKGKELNLNGAMVDPFWKFSPEKDYVPLDIVKALDSLLKKIVTDQEKTSRKHGYAIEALEMVKATVTGQPVESATLESIKAQIEVRLNANAKLAATLGNAGNPAKAATRKARAKAKAAQPATLAA